MLSDVAELFDGAVIAPRADRRMSRRLLDAWARGARGRFPSWDAMRTADLGDDWKWAFVIDLEKSDGFPYFSYLGEHLAKLSTVYLSGSSDWTMSILDMVSNEIGAAVGEEAPHFRDDELTLCDGRRIQFRLVTTPLADDGENITHVMGIANGCFARDAAARKGPRQVS